MSALGKLASDTIINLNLYFTVNENIVLIFLLIGYTKQLTKQRNGKTKSV